MSHEKIQKLVYSAIFLALALVLPFLTGQIPAIGARISPMHIPVLLCGFVCGAPWGLLVGLAAPLLRSLMFGMPRLYPTALAMMFELAAYGAAAGIFYRLLPKKPWGVYASLIAAMLVGRVVWGAAQFVLLSFGDTPFTMQAFMAGAFINAVPAIILHIVLIPFVVMGLQRAGLILND